MAKNAKNVGTANAGTAVMGPKGENLLHPNDAASIPSGAKKAPKPGTVRFYIVKAMVAAGPNGITRANGYKIRPTWAKHHLPDCMRILASEYGYDITVIGDPKSPDARWVLNGATGTPETEHKRTAKPRTGKGRNAAPIGAIADAKPGVTIGAGTGAVPDTAAVEAANVNADATANVNADAEPSAPVDLSGLDPDA